MIIIKNTMVNKILKVIICVFSIIIIFTGCKNSVDNSSDSESNSNDSITSEYTSDNSTETNSESESTNISISNESESSESGTESQMESSKVSSRTSSKISSQISSNVNSSSIESDIESDTEIPVAVTYWVSVNGDDFNPGTKEEPFRSIETASSMVKAGDTVKIMPGTYYESIYIYATGTREMPITFESTIRHGAVISGYSNHFRPFSNSTGDYVTIRGIWFNDCPLSADGMFSEQVIMPGRGWAVEDCRFSNSGVGIGYNSSGRNVSDTSVLRCVFEDMDVTASWAWGSVNKLMENHLIKDTIIRRTNRLNFDPGWGAMGMKYGFTKNLVADGVISYDNNGIGFWLDWKNDNFTVKNSTFFGNHAGMAYANFQDNSIQDRSWAGIGFASEGNVSGVLTNNVAYSNLNAGFSMWESGKGGGIDITGNIFADNSQNIELRAMNRDEFGHNPRLGDLNISNNTFFTWKSANISTTSLMETAAGYPLPGDAGIVIDENEYNFPDKPLNLTISKWLSKNVTKFSDLFPILKIEESFIQGDTEFSAPLIAVYKTTLADVGTSRMWQVDSLQAENNNIDKITGKAKLGDIVKIPVSGRKQFVKSGNDWFTEVYDLQARYIKIKLNESQKIWLEENVLSYASIKQVEIQVKITKLQPYSIEASMVTG